MNQADAFLDSLPQRAGDPDVFVCANGLRLRLKRVSQMIVAEANRKMPPPRVPKTWIEELKREEENPNDPDYLRAVSEYRHDTAMLAMRIYFIMGTEPVLPLPRDLEPPEANGWVEMLQAAYDDIAVPDSGPRRYLEWLKMYALPNEDQTRLLIEIVRFSGGTMEEDVKQAQDSFRDNEGRGAASAVPAATVEAQPEPGVPSDSRNGAGLRSEGSSGIRALPMGSLDDDVHVV